MTVVRIKHCYSSCKCWLLVALVSVCNIISYPSLILLPNYEANLFILVSVICGEQQEVPFLLKFTSWMRFLAKECQTLFNSRVNPAG